MPYASLDEDYVLQVLKAWKGPVDNPFHFLQDNLFAFFRPSTDAMRKRYVEFQEGMARIMVLKTDRRTLLHVDTSKVLNIFTHKLSQVEEADWTAEKLGDVVKKLTDSIKFYDTLENKDKFESAGWAFMRHGLVNGKVGSALVPLMLLFGQRETVRRIRDARKIAQKEEELLRCAQKAEAKRAQEQVAQKGTAPEKTAHHGESKKNELMQVYDRESRQEEASGEGDRYDMDPGIVKVYDQGAPRFTTPAGEAPFRIYLQKEQGRGPPSEEGPFKSSPPTPPPPRSPPKDPSEVERSSRFLSLPEFKFATRHLDLSKEPGTHGPDLNYVARLQRQQEAGIQGHQTPKKVRVDAIIKADEGGWAHPVSRTLEGQDAHSGSQGPGPSGVQIAPKADNAFDTKSHDRVEHSSKNHDTATTAEHANIPGVVKKTGPFKPAGIERPVDRSSHVEFLRGLNRALAVKNAKVRRRRLLGKTRKSPNKLNQLKATGLGPMSPKSGAPDKSEDAVAVDAGEDSQHAAGGEQTTVSAPVHDRPTMQK